MLGIKTISVHTSQFDNQSKTVSNYSFFNFPDSSKRIGMEGEGQELFVVISASGFGEYLFRFFVFYSFIQIIDILILWIILLILRLLRIVLFRFLGTRLLYIVIYITNFMVMELFWHFPLVQYLIVL